MTTTGSRRAAAGEAGRARGLFFVGDWQMCWRWTAKSLRRGPDARHMWWQPRQCRWGKGVCAVAMVERPVVNGPFFFCRNGFEMVSGVFSASFWNIEPNDFRARRERRCFFLLDSHWGCMDSDLCGQACLLSISCCRCGGSRCWRLCVCFRRSCRLYCCSRRCELPVFSVLPAMSVASVLSVLP